jgi:hypothetical protein
VDPIFYPSPSSFPQFRALILFDPLAPSEKQKISRKITQMERKIAELSGTTPAPSDVKVEEAKDAKAKAAALKAKAKAEAAAAAVAALSPAERSEQLKKAQAELEKWKADLEYVVVRVKLC